MYIIKKIKSYAKYLHYVFLDARELFLYRVALFIILSMMGLMSKIIGVILLTLLFRDDGLLVISENLMPSGMLSFSEVIFSFNESTILISLFFFIGAVFSYVSNRIVLSLSIIYERFCCARAIFTLTQHGQFNEKTGSDFRQLQIIVIRESRLLGRVLRLLLRSIYPLIQSVVAFSAMLYIDKLNAFSILSIVLLSGVMQYRVSVASAKYTRNYEESIYGCKLSKKKLIKQALSSNELTLEDVRNNLDVDAVNSNEHYFISRVRVVGDSIFVNEVTLSIVILILLVSMSYGNVAQDYNWSELLAFAMLTVFFLNGLRGMFSSLTNISRFYPNMARYFNFVKNGKVVV